VPNALFADNRRRLCQRLIENPSVPKNAFVLLQGGESLSVYDTDVDYIFRQVGWTKLLDLFFMKPAVKQLFSGAVVSSSVVFGVRDFFKYVVGLISKQDFYMTHNTYGSEHCLVYLAKWP
jgi:Xaa-Pro dipeptidase